MARISACLISKLYQFLSPRWAIGEKTGQFYDKEANECISIFRVPLDHKIGGISEKIVVKIKSRKLFKEKIKDFL